MFRKRIPLFSISGFRVAIAPSWLVLAALVAWSLSTGFFPYQVENLGAGWYWLMGVIGAVGLFVSIILHELSHSLVARRSGVPMQGITLFLFGGLAETGDEPGRARDEFLIAVVGPAASLLLGAGFLALGGASAGMGWPRPVGAVLDYLGVINIVLAGFNLLPAYPLDGGRILRAALWAWRGRMIWATRVASRIGQGFGLLLVALGVVRLVAGMAVGGVWMVLIGLFLRHAAAISHQQLLMREALGDRTVRDFMRTDPRAVSPQTSVEDLLADVTASREDRVFPVADDQGRLMGCVTRRRADAVDRTRRPETTASDLMDGCSRRNSIAPDADAAEALRTMHQHGTDRLLVTRDGQLAGTVARRDLLEHVTTALRQTSDR
jgi:Zn-dependent protease